MNKKNNSNNKNRDRKKLTKRQCENTQFVIEQVAGIWVCFEIMKRFECYNILKDVPDYGGADEDTGGAKMRFKEE